MDRRGQSLDFNIIDDGALSKGAGKWGQSRVHGFTFEWGADLALEIDLDEVDVATGQTTGWGRVRFGHPVEDARSAADELRVGFGPHNFLDGFK